MQEHLKHKAYLGDGLYAGFDGYQFWLFTHEGMEVALEPAVVDAFTAYVAGLYETFRAKKKEEVAK
jgi:hypothetical protein